MPCIRTTEMTLPVDMGSPQSGMVEKRTPITRREVNGVLLLDKPAGLSSTQAMAAAKRLFRATKAGHTGTLDPFATGLLPVCFGEATKFSRFMLEARKSYCATLKLGEVSSTGDTEGVITQQSAVDVDEAQVQRVLHGFLGDQTQTPPMHSALKQNGVPLYQLARKGIEVERAPRAITINAISLVSFAGSQMVIDVDVSKGTYIRVLAEDIGRMLGCGAHLTDLRRTATGGFEVANAHTLDALAAFDPTGLDELLLTPQSLCAVLPEMQLDTADANIFCHGGWVAIEAVVPALGEHAIYGPGRLFLGVGDVSVLAGRTRLSPTRVTASRS